MNTQDNNLVLTIDPSTCTKAQWHVLKHHIHTTEKCLVACVSQLRYYGVEERNLRDRGGQSYILHDIANHKMEVAKQERVYREQLTGLYALKDRCIEAFKARADRDKSWITSALWVRQVIEAERAHR